MLASEFAKKGQKYLGESYNVLDCQALVEAMLYDIGIKKNWRGSNDMFRDMAWVGTPEECVSLYGKVPIGAFLFILEDDGGEPQRYKADGIGNASHVGVKTGIGKGAIHSSSSRGGVVESSFNDKTIKNGGWNRVGLCKLLDYNIEKGENMESATVFAETGSSVNMRTSPHGSLVARVPIGEVVIVSGHQDGWSRVLYNGNSGWMMDEFLKMDAKEEKEKSLEERVSAIEKALQAMGWNKSDGSFG